MSFTETDRSIGSPTPSRLRSSVTRTGSTTCRLATAARACRGELEPRAIVGHAFDVCEIAPALRGSPGRRTTFGATPAWRGMSGAANRPHHNRPADGRKPDDARQAPLRDG